MVDWYPCGSCEGLRVLRGKCSLMDGWMGLDERALGVVV